jgi:hypothetical protein
MNGIQMKDAPNGAREQAQPPRATTLLPPDLENRVVRQAVRENLVSFPSQIPVFEKQSRPDLQAKLAVLYFVRGWTMDDIAQRYGLVRQRMGQILTAWRIRAVNEGHIQVILPEHPLFKRVRQQARQAAQAPVWANSALTTAARPASASEASTPKLAVTGVRAPGESSVAEELQAIVGILENQLRLCSKLLYGSIDSCELLLVRAKALCKHLEAQCPAENSKGDDSTSTAISSANRLFQQFREHAAERSGQNRIIRPRFAVSGESFRGYARRRTP